jgi:hypothetical protein
MVTHQILALRIEVRALAGKLKTGAHCSYTRGRVINLHMLIVVPAEGSHLVVLVNPKRAMPIT